jgi:N-acetylglucosamine kinase-like BadF-type ATPase
LPSDYVLGVDGGGTWTRSVITRLDGTVMGMGRSGPSNPITVGVEQALKNIFEAVNDAGEGSGIEEFKASVLGLAGASRSRLGKKMLKCLPKYYGETRIVSDALSALAGATGCRPGVVVIAGTGSIAYGVNLKEEEARAGGWGWRLGDEGSGYTIGRNALNAALKDHDLSGPPTILKEMILSHLGLSDLEEVIDWAYDPEREPSHFASLVPIVKTAEKKGDKVASLIMEDAGAQLGLVTQAVIKRLKLVGVFPLACCGGVFKQPNRYNVAFEETVRKVAPDCVFIEPLFSPTVGSALLGFKSLGVEINEDLLAKVEKSLRQLE